MLALIPLFPLIGFLLNGVWYAFFQAPKGRTKAHALVPGVIATGAIAASFVVALQTFLQLKGMPESDRVLEQILFSWMSVGKQFNLDMGFRVDALNSLFTLVITGVGTLIHLYSVGYMSHDESPGKFFAYLNLFCFAMLMLVMGSSLPILFLGWEGVGLCSYLLIGFWYTDIEKAKAGKKAFIVNRVGDFGFLLGMFLIFYHFGTLDFAQLQTLFASAGSAEGHSQAWASGGLVTTICLLLFVGCMGKSAQIPLYVWLPDAMAGPTPVSALIHAATMVTSGIYMLSRLNFMYQQSHQAMFFVACVGAVTAFFAATIALVQTDIKKVLAYSTVSQLGYMFLACGVGGFQAGVFHVMTHAFFKALLFLGAGSVIHGMHEEQNILKMGGLKKFMPVTHLTWVIGWLAICGLPPFAGFFSKDEILWLTFSSEHGSKVLWALAAVTAIMTSFYMTRLTVLTFWGKSRIHPSLLPSAAGHSEKHETHGEDHGHGHAGVHESPWMMTLPLGVLALLSLVGGWIGIPHMSWLGHWLEPVLGAHATPEGVNPQMEWILMGLSVMGALVGVGAGLGLYRDLSKPAALREQFSGLHRILENKWYVDELYEAVWVRPIAGLSEILWKGFDVAFLDRIVVGFGKLTQMTGQTLRYVQTGSIQTYAIAVLLGAITTLGYLVGYLIYGKL